MPGSHCTVQILLPLDIARADLVRFTEAIRVGFARAAKLAQQTQPPHQRDRATVELLVRSYPISGYAARVVRSALETASGFARGTAAACSGAFVAGGAIGVGAAFRARAIGVQISRAGADAGEARVLVALLAGGASRTVLSFATRLAVVHAKRHGLSARVRGAARAAAGRSTIRVGGAGDATAAAQTPPSSSDVAVVVLRARGVLSDAAVLSEPRRRAERALGDAAIGFGKSSEQAVLADRAVGVGLAGSAASVAEAAPTGRTRRLVAAVLPAHAVDHRAEADAMVSDRAIRELDGRRSSARRRNLRAWCRAGCTRY